MIDANALHELAAGLGVKLPDEAATRLLAYLDAMLVENEKVNLTAVREREEAVMFHALDSFALGLAQLDAAPARALDLGTGNGFPGVAIACLYPWAKVALMDRTGKKLKAIERALTAAGFDLARFETIHLDAREAPAHGFERAFDLITARAVTTPEELAPQAKPLMARDARLVCWLSAETAAPSQLKGALKRVADVEYALPAPADRRRRIVTYARGGGRQASRRRR